MPNYWLHGAQVVVNDLGGSIEGAGTDPGVASAVVDSIMSAGGAALADSSDVSTAAGGLSLIDAAVDHFGRIDILVNNAGIIRWAGLPDADLDNLAGHLAVHVLGSFNTTRAAWPHMVDQGYGRIVMTTSSGLFGLPENLSYATAKGAVIGLTRSLTTAGTKHGIKVNLIAPAAFTRMAGRAAAETDATGGGGPSPWMSPALVAPMVAYLAHEACPVSGEIYAAGFGRFARIFIASTEGYLHPTPDPTVEDVARHWATINDDSSYYIPADLMGWSAAFMAHLSSDEGAADGGRKPPSDTAVR